MILFANQVWGNVNQKIWLSNRCEVDWSDWSNPSKSIKVIVEAIESRLKIYIFLKLWLTSIGIKWLRLTWIDLINQNLFHLNFEEQQTFKQLIQLIHEEKGDAKVAKPLLVALLEKSRNLYSTYASEEKFLSKKMLTVRKYKSLISNSFLENKEVSFYADQLNVSSNYLNEIVKAETGISAKRHITERVLLEAKNLLLYSAMDITEISYALHFSEPTHFTKFFKKETGTTPKSFQNQKP